MLLQLQKFFLNKYLCHLQSDQCASTIKWKKFSHRTNVYKECQEGITAAEVCLER